MEISSYLLDKMLPFRSACVSSRYYWYYARDICARVIYRQYHASCILQVPSFIHTNAKYGINPHAVVTKHFSILYAIHCVKLNRYDQSSHKIAHRTNEIHSFDTTFVTVSPEEETFFHGRIRTRVHVHGTFAKKNCIAVFRQEIMAKTRTNVTCYIFLKRQKLYKA